MSFLLAESKDNYSDGIRAGQVFNWAEDIQEINIPY